MGGWRTLRPKPRSGKSRGGNDRKATVISIRGRNCSTHEKETKGEKNLESLR